MGIFQESSHQTSQDGGLKTNCNHSGTKENSLKRHACVFPFDYHIIVTVHSPRSCNFPRNLSLDEGDSQNPAVVRNGTCLSRKDGTQF